MLYKIIVVMMIVILQTSCTALLVAGGAAGGYYVAKDKRSISQIANDASITASIKSKLITTKDVSSMNINVDTENSVVTLHGHVQNVLIRSKVIDIAKATKDVSRVISKLKVVPNNL